MTKREKAALKEIGNLFMAVRMNIIPDKANEFSERVHSCLISLYCGEPARRVEEKIEYAKELLGPNFTSPFDLLRDRLNEEPTP